ncbi:MAG TPA: 4'-phosphopantetheinyl transferase superfamily protein [Candidatus Sulfopaludibacter sp.]|nr:4'-phosphopantetheinyl transferase superfamily protein [Candidatus Sulfopaludibacter sp.]
MSPGELHVWLIHVDKLRDEQLPAATPGEVARSLQFSGVQRRRYLRAHRAMRAILQSLTNVDLRFAITERGKPFLATAPELKFNLARSKSMALVAASLNIDVGADIERLHPLTDYMGIAERFLPPAAAAEFAAVFQPDPEREFFRRWTRTEAMLKATGEGLYGAGREVEGEWTVAEIDAGARYAAAVAAPSPGLQVIAHTFGE